MTTKRQRVGNAETQKQILDLLEKNGPMQRWQIADALGRSPDQTISTMVKHGMVDQYEAKNNHPNGRYTRDTATYFSFITREKFKAVGKGEYNAVTVAWCIEVLQAMGYTVEKPNTAVSGPQRPKENNDD